ncbi:tetratricopeptide repeat protein [Gimesia fumaroli]|uniref:Photosystem I assembly protein Ycf3 n=1 Tax=Gimesia fumaroli TaxID=2527976 RepID=A0A518IAU8_9PLAN|nr:tetratricopeptide repeat protein [Gimesia fumaroli]QDV50224.1 photosystem I assembly protein Ycf3 [Gimesia fumaroli]
MNNKGLFCSTVILLITFSIQGCASLGNQVSKVKSALPGQKKPQNMLAAGRSYESKNEWLAAREQYEKHLKKDPKSVKACHRLGIVCSRLGDSVAATRYFTQARQLDPTNSEVLNDFGYALFQRGQYDAAEKIFTAALQNDAKNSRIINNLALTVGHQGRFKESFTLFRNIMPPAEAHANLAYIHTQRGEGELALEEYDLALTEDPTLETAGLAAAELAEMKNIYLAKQEQKPEQKLAANQGTPQTKAPKREVTPAETPAKTQPARQTTQLVSAKQPVERTPRQSLNATTPVVRQKLISQTSLKEEQEEIQFRPVVSQPPVSKPVMSQPAVKAEEDALEINTFNSIDELSLEEKPAIIRISNESEPEETLFRSPQELSEN